MSNTHELDLKIANYMHDLGVPVHIKGYLYIREAIKMGVQDRDILSPLTKELYPSIAKVFNTTPSKVGRAIRHAIEITFKNSNSKLLHDIFDIYIDKQKDKPINSLFIAVIVDRITLEEEMRKWMKK